MSNNYKLYFVSLLTLSRIPLSVGFYFAVDSMEVGISGYVLPLIILSIIELTDIFDGVLARKFSVVTEYGATFDPYADSISRFVIYITLASHGLCLFLLPVIMAIRDITVAYSRIIITSKGKSVSAKWSGKMKAISQAVGAYVLLLFPLVAFESAMPVVSWVLIVITALSAYEYIESAVLKIVRGY